MPTTAWLPHSVVVALLVTAAVACSGDGPAAPREPEGSPGPSLEILSGGEVTDTIGLTLDEPFIVRVLDGSGQPAGSVAVDFDVPEDYVSIAEATGTDRFSYATRAWTDSDGQAGVRVHFEREPGSTVVRTKVPVFGLADSVPYTVLPGAPHRINVGPRDTVVSLEDTWTVRTDVVDRYSNFLEWGPLLLEVDTLGLSHDGNDVTAERVGRYHLTGREPEERLPPSTIPVTVTPGGRILYPGFSKGILLIDPGGVQRRITDDPASMPRWGAGGTRVVSVWKEGIQVHEVETGQRSVVAAPDLSSVEWPVFSPDGAWIYFEAQGEGERGIYRVRPDGSDLDRITPRAEHAVRPSFSPDGARLAYMGNHELVVLHLESGTKEVILSGPFDHLDWSPTGGWIAVQNGDGLRVVRPDGSEVRSVKEPEGIFWYGTFTWTPDGAYLFAVDGAFPALFAVEGDEELHLNWLWTSGAPNRGSLHWIR